MRNRRPKVKINIPMCIACILLCLTLISFHLSNGLYAKYVATTFGGDGARVARFDVSENGAYFSEELLIETIPGTLERTIEVVNNSEVAVAYSVTIENVTKNIPYSFSVNDGALQKDICTGVYNMAPNSTAKITIKAFWSPIGALKFMGMVDLVKLTVRAEQID